MASTHPPPSPERIRKVVRKIKTLLRYYPDDVSAPCWQSWLYALGWVLGENDQFDRDFQTRKKGT